MQVATVLEAVEVHKAHWSVTAVKPAGQSVPKTVRYGPGLTQAIASQMSASGASVKSLWEPSHPTTDVSRDERRRRTPRYFVDVTVGQASSYTTGYILDELYRPWKVVQSGVDVEEKAATIEYRADGRVSRIDRFESLETIASNIVASTLYDYSLNNHVEKISHYGALPGGILISQDLYTYDSDWRLFTTVSIQDGTTTYDYVGQFRSVTVGGPVNSSETFQYDINGD